MSLISRVTTWVSGQVLKAVDLNGEFNNVVNTINNLDGTTTAWTNVKTGTLNVTGASTLTSFSTALFSYRRPVLQYASGTVVNLETGNNGTSGQAAVMFPDGTLRTDSTAGRINCNLAQVAILSGAAQSGLRTGTVAMNTWYAVYAVKVTDSTTNFVTVADVTPPLQANFTNLNTYFGTNGWVYIGSVRVGDQNAGSTVILQFTQAGNMTILTNVCTGLSIPGINMAVNSASSPVTYTYSAGTSGTVIPANLTQVQWVGSSSSNGGVLNSARYQATAVYLFSVGGPSGLSTLKTGFEPAAQGLIFAGNAGAGPVIYINLSGWVDGALGIGSNPLL